MRNISVLMLLVSSLISVYMGWSLLLFAGSGIVLLFCIVFVCEFFHRRSLSSNLELELDKLRRERMDVLSRILLLSYIIE